MGITCLTVPRTEDSRPSQMNFSQQTCPVNSEEGSSMFHILLFHNVKIPSKSQQNFQALHHDGTLHFPTIQFSLIIRTSRKAAASKFYPLGPKTKFFPE